MKKIVVGILAAAVVASSAITGAAGHIKSQAAARGSNYVDCDGNGICDNYADKVCDGSGTGKVKTAVAAAVDSIENMTCQAVNCYVDGDGVCDHDTDRNCDGSGSGNANVGSDTVTESTPAVETVTQPVQTAESVNTAPKGSNYVDSDGDGVCDNYTGGNCQGNGNGTGSGCGNANAHHGCNGGGNCFRGGKNR